MDVYDSPAEHDQHEQAMEALAKELNRNVVEVHSIYERAYLDLKSDATVTAYLPLFVERRTRALLRERST